MAIILGIESTAHTFGIGVVRDGEILANVREMYTTEEGGIIPMDSAKHHAEVAEDVCKRALEEAGIFKLTPKGVPQGGASSSSSPRNFSEEKFTEGIDAIAFSQGPGLAPCLLEGMKFAKNLAKGSAHPPTRKSGVPIVPVNHCIAHLEIGKITGARDPVMLYASGANTQVIAYEAGKYRVFGETLDVGVGNFIDNFARFLGIGFPGGPKIEKLAEESKTYIELPYKVKGMDIALSGILTNLKQKIESGKFKKEDLAFSMQETVFAMLVEIAERALAHTGKNELLLGGGVACNSRLQEMCRIMCEERGAKFFVPERPLLVDNAAMIAYLGEIMFAKGIKETDLDKIDIHPRERTDDVIVSWK